METINRIPLILEKEAGKDFFQFHIYDKVIAMEYELVYGNTLRLIHTKIPKGANFKKAVSIFLERVMEYAYRGNYCVIPYCSKAKAFLKENKRYSCLITQEQT